jgi:predicted secreted Zn-dependent protease
MEREADRVTQEVVGRYHELEERYDLETNHGASDGAVFP